MNVLKLIRGIIQGVAIVVMIAFVLNGVGGLMGAIEMVEFDNFNLNDMDSGDLDVQYSNLHLELGVNITNTGMYDYENVLLGVVFELRPNTTEIWTQVLNKTSADLNSSASSDGVTIFKGDTEQISLIADVTDFNVDQAQIGALFGYTPANITSFNLATMDHSAYDMRAIVYFSIDFAFKQYRVDINMTCSEEFLAGGFA